MKSLYECIMESSSLYHDLIEPYEFDLDKALETSEFSIDIRHYANHYTKKFVDNYHYWQGANVNEFRKILNKIKKGKEFKQEIMDEYFVSLFWENMDTVKKVIKVGIHVSGTYNSGLELYVDCETGEAYKVDVFSDLAMVKDPDKKLTSGWMLKRARKWDGEFI